MCSNMFDLLWRKGVNGTTNDNTDDCIITLYNILKKRNFDIFKIKKFVHVVYTIVAYYKLSMCRPVGIEIVPP